MEIVIGTATFGTDYGIANQGRVQTESVALEILAKAQHLGIFDLDTSPEYLNAEEVIGKYHTARPKFNCYSKISRRILNSPSETLLSLNNSLKLMKVDSLSGLYFHNPDELLAIDPEAIENLIDSIEATDRVQKIGASVYELDEILKIRERHPRITLFQVPENIADQRLRNSVQMELLHKIGIEFHVRSIFLQGLLLMKSAPAHLASAQPFLDSLNETARLRNCSPLDLCVSYVKQLGWASKVVIGVSTVAQLQEIKLAINVLEEEAQIDVELPDSIRDPRKWHHE